MREFRCSVRCGGCGDCAEWEIVRDHRRLAWEVRARHAGYGVTQFVDMVLAEQVGRVVAETVLGQMAERLLVRTGCAAA